MARQEEDREDLLREATALVERAELHTASEAEAVVVGFRRDGAASVFLGGEPVYQFNPRGELRRAYHQGLLYKAERGLLVSLRRRRVPGEVQLLRQELSAEEGRLFLEELTRRMTALRHDLQNGQFKLIGQAPESTDVFRRIAAWLDVLVLPPAVATGPRAGG